MSRELGPREYCFNEKEQIEQLVVYIVPVNKYKCEMKHLSDSFIS